jgi:hypothetical protein
MTSTIALLAVLTLFFAVHHAEAAQDNHRDLTAEGSPAFEGQRSLSYTLAADSNDSFFTFEESIAAGEDGSALDLLDVLSLRNRNGGRIQPDQWARFHVSLADVSIHCCFSGVMNIWMVELTCRISHCGKFVSASEEFEHLYSYDDSSLHLSFENEERAKSFASLASGHAGDGLLRAFLGNSPGPSPPGQSSPAQGTSVQAPLFSRNTVITGTSQTSSEESLSPSENTGIRPSPAPGLPKALTASTHNRSSGKIPSPANRNHASSRAHTRPGLPRVLSAKAAIQTGPAVSVRAPATDGDKSSLSDATTPNGVSQVAASSDPTVGANASDASMPSQGPDSVHGLAASSNASQASRTITILKSASSNVNVRQKPEISSRVVAWVRPGESYALSRTVGNWYFLASKGGWVLGKYVTVER